MFFCCDCCVLSGKWSLRRITRPEESYRLSRVVVYDHETAKKNEEAKAPLPGCENSTTMGCNAKKTNITNSYRVLTADSSLPHLSMCVRVNP